MYATHFCWYWFYMVFTTLLLLYKYCTLLLNHGVELHKSLGCIGIGETSLHYLRIMLHAPKGKRLTNDWYSNMGSLVVFGMCLCSFILRKMYAIERCDLSGGFRQRSQSPSSCIMSRVVWVRILASLKKKTSTSLIYIKSEVAAPKPLHGSLKLVTGKVIFHFLG